MLPDPRHAALSRCATELAATAARLERVDAAAGVTGAVAVAIGRVVADLARDLRVLSGQVEGGFDQLSRRVGR